MKIVQLARFAVGGRDSAESPSGAPDRGLCFVVTLVLSEGRPAAVMPDGKSYAT